MIEKRVECIICNDEHWIETIVDGEIESRRCICFTRRTILAFLGPELAKARHIKSDLFLPEVDPDTNQVSGDRTQDDLFIKGVWSEVAQHLRWALGGRKHDSSVFTFKMVNDEMLLRVWLGHFAYSNRSRNVRDEMETYNNVSDLVSSHSLLIIRLGKLAYKNVAAGGVLQEALNIRASESKPTWLIEGEHYFGDGHLFYNYEVGRYIDDNFDVVDVGGDVKAAQELRAALELIDTDTVSVAVNTEAPAPLVATQERFFAECSLGDRGNRKKKWRKGGGNNRGGLGSEVI